MSPPTWRRALVAGAVLLAGAGCDTGDGRSLDQPAPGATAPPLPTSSTATTVPAPTAVPTDPAFLATFLSPAIAAETAIPDRFTCDAEDLSPPLQWGSIPPEAVELAIVVHDPDAPGGDFLHWLIAGIDPATIGFVEGALPETAVEVRPWTGPCPPRGEVHEYEFALYVLREPSGILAETDAEVARGVLEAGYDQVAIFHATYGREA